MLNAPHMSMERLFVNVCTLMSCSKLHNHAEKWCRPPHSQLLLLGHKHWWWEIIYKVHTSIKSPTSNINVNPEIKKCCYPRVTEPLSYIRLLLWCVVITATLCDITCFRKLHSQVGESHHVLCRQCVRCCCGSMTDAEPLSEHRYVWTCTRD